MPIKIFYKANNFLIILISGFVKKNNENFLFLLFIKFSIHLGEARTRRAYSHLKCSSQQVTICPHPTIAI